MSVEHTALPFYPNCDLACYSPTAHIASVPERDASQEALRQVELITDSKPVRGETLLRSRKLKRQLAKAKEREAKRSRSSK